jgi:hypothetical protein
MFRDPQTRKHKSRRDGYFGRYSIELCRAPWRLAGKCCCGRGRFRTGDPLDRAARQTARRPTQAGIEDRLGADAAAIRALKSCWPFLCYSGGNPSESIPGTAA